MSFISTLKTAILEWWRPRGAKSWPLEHQIQAQAFSLLLQEEGIPHRIRRHGDALFGYSQQVEDGWGSLEADPEHHERIDALWKAFLEAEFVPDGEGEPTDPKA